MSGRLKNLRGADPVLTNLAIGYSNEEMVGEFILPFVNIPKEAATIPKFGKSAFKLYKTLRAIRSASNRKNPEGIERITVTLDEHDIEEPIDYREEAESEFEQEMLATYSVTETIQIRREYDISQMVQNPDNYDADNHTALSGTSQFSDPDSDVIAIFDEAKEAVSKKTGKKPNRCVLSRDTFLALRRHPQLLEQTKHVQKGFLSLKDLEELLELEIRVGEGIYANEEGLERFWQKSAWIGYIPKPIIKDKLLVGQPSFGYTIRRKGNPRVDKYTENGGKLKLVRNTDIFKPYVLGKDAGYLISNTVA